MISSYDSLIKEQAQFYDVNMVLVKAIITVESNFNPYAIRYEPLWHYFKDVENCAKLVNTTSMTEHVMQATSWGLMQIMGSVARELGYTLPLPALCIPETNIKVGCQKLDSLSKKYDSLGDIVSAYNAGTPTKINGEYVNKGYVAKVIEAYNHVNFI